MLRIRRVKRILRHRFPAVQAEEKAGAGFAPWAKTRFPFLQAWLKGAESAKK